jgi:hypothetical protein
MKTNSKKQVTERNLAFLSHAHADRPIAKEIATLIERVTLNRITVWYSSDENASGGIGAGELWLKSIRSNLEKSRTVVALVTPSSRNRPWIYFESGFGAAHAELEVIPVCIGIDVRDIPAPLGMYQAFKLSDVSSINLFLRKVLIKFDVAYDEEMAKVVVEPALRKIVEAASRQQTKEPTQDLALSALVAELKDHIDRRLAGPGAAATTKGDQDNHTYTVPLRIRLPGFEFNDFLKVGPNDSVGDKLNEIYILSHDHIAPYTYLEEWLLRDTKTNENLIVREIADRIPAQAIFRRGSKWEMIKLDRPYSGGDTATSRPQLETRKIYNLGPNEE